MDTYAVDLLTTSSVLTAQFHFTRHCKSVTDILRLRRGVTLLAGLGANCRPAAVCQRAAGEGEGVLKTDENSGLGRTEGGDRAYTATVLKIVKVLCAFGFCSILYV